MTHKGQLKRLKNKCGNICGKNNDCVTISFKISKKHSQKKITQSGNVRLVFLDVYLLQRSFTASIGSSPADTVLSLDVFKKGCLFASCAKVSMHVTKAETKETMIVAHACNPQMSTHLLFYN